MFLKILLLLPQLFFFVHADAHIDICVVRIQDGHSNEHDSISKTHCEMYDRLNHNNTSTMQTIDLDGTIAGCWIYETDADELFYWNTNLNPSGMCAHPHYCVQYVDCDAGVEAMEVLYLAPPPPPTAPTVGIGTVDLTPAPTPTGSTTRKDPQINSKDIIMIMMLILVVTIIIVGYFVVRTNKRSRLTYP